MKSDDRRIQQKKLLSSAITIGDCSDLPFDLSILEELPNSYVVKTLTSGLTATVYKLRYDGKDYCVKVKRTESLVKNEDGQLAFLNEILCRKVIENNRHNPIINKGITHTYYADNLKGLIISEWIEGQHAKSYSRQMIQSIFSLNIELMKIGLFEWDLCSGNLMFEGNEVKMFDFGYMYPMDLKEGINSEDMDAPIFHTVERFETRSYMPYLLDLEDQLDNYRLLKEEAVKAYQTLIDDISEWASQKVISHYESLVAEWQNALNGNLESLYLKESSRSYALDIHDDLSGQSCTNHTLKKIEKIISILANQPSTYYPLWFDQDYDTPALINVYKERLTLAKTFLIGV